MPESCDRLVGMKSISDYVRMSESTVLKLNRESGLPIRKSAKNGNAGIWLGSKKKIDAWFAAYVEESGK